jgi:hypothetical protein
MHTLGQRDGRSGLARVFATRLPSALIVPATRAAVVARVALPSELLGLSPGCKGLAPGGAAGVGQVQLLQPFSTLLASALLLTKQVDAATGIATAALVVIGIGRRISIASSAT